MVAICYSGPISADPTKEQLLWDERTCAKFLIDISKIEGPVCVYTDRRTHISITYLKTAKTLTRTKIKL